jgi:hypothetical protein
MAQYAQVVDESVYAVSAQLIPGLRGRARTLVHYPDWLEEGPIGAIYEINRGFRFTYLPQRMKTFVRNTPQLRVSVNGRTITPFRFKAQGISELSTSQCT